MKSAVVMYRRGHPFVSLAQAALYRGPGFSIVWPQFLALIAIGGVFFGLALGRFRKTIGTTA